MTLYELATTGNDNELWGWIDAPKEQFDMLYACPGRRNANHEEFRMAMLFVWWATQ